MMCSAYERWEGRFEAGVAYVATAWIPKTPIAFAAACLGGWYGRQVATIYAPGFVALYFKEVVVDLVGDVAKGALLNVGLVTPAVVPTIVPYLVDLAGLAMFALVAFICNLAIKYLRIHKQTEQA